MSDEKVKKKDNAEATMLTGMGMASVALSIILIVLGSFISSFELFAMADDWLLRCLSPFFGMMMLIISYGVIRWAVYYGIYYALADHNKRAVEEEAEEIIETVLQEKWTEQSRNV